MAIRHSQMARHLGHPVTRNAGHLCQHFAPFEEQHVRGHSGHRWNHMVPMWPSLPRLLSAHLHGVKATIVGANSCALPLVRRVISAEFASFRAARRLGRYSLRSETSKRLGDGAAGCCFDETKESPVACRLTAAASGRSGLRKPCTPSVSEQTFWAKQAGVDALQGTRISSDGTMSTRRCARQWAPLDLATVANGLHTPLIGLSTTRRRLSDTLTPEISLSVL